MYRCFRCFAASTLWILFLSVGHAGGIVHRKAMASLVSGCGFWGIGYLGMICFKDTDKAMETYDVSGWREDFLAEQDHNSQVVICGPFFGRRVEGYATIGG